jgi:hypothetical protein
MIGSFSGLVRRVFLVILSSLSSSSGTRILVDGRFGEGCTATNVSVSGRCALDFLERRWRTGGLVSPAEAGELELVH